MNVNFTSFVSKTGPLPLQSLLNEHRNNIRGRLDQKALIKEITDGNITSNKQRKQKRAVSAFVLFCKDYYRQKEDKNIKLCAWELSLECGKIWGEMTKQEKEPYIKEHKRLSEKYYIEMGKENIIDHQLLTNQKIHVKNSLPAPQIALDTEYQYLKQVQEIKEKDQALIDLLKVDHDDIFNHNFTPLIPNITHSTDAADIKPIFIIERAIKKPKIIDRYSYLPSFSSEDRVIFNEGIDTNNIAASCKIADDKYY